MPVTAKDIVRDKSGTFYYVRGDTVSAVPSWEALRQLGIDPQNPAGVKQVAYNVAVGKNVVPWQEATAPEAEISAQAMGSNTISPDDFARDPQGKYWIVGGGSKAAVEEAWIRDYYALNPALVPQREVAQIPTVALSQHPRYKEINTIMSGGTVAPPAGVYSGGEFGYPGYQPQIGRAHV